MNSKGVTFTFITILLISILVFSILLHNNTKSEAKINKDIVRIETVNGYVSALNNHYIRNELKVSTSKALTSISNYSEEGNEFETQDELISTMKNLIIYGKINPTDLSFYPDMTYESKGNLEYFSLPALLEKELQFLAITEQGLIFRPVLDNFNEDKFISIDFREFLESNLMIHSDISQTEPDLIQINLSLNYNVSDQTNRLGWVLTGKNFSVFSDLTGKETIISPCKSCILEQGNVWCTKIIPSYGQCSEDDDTFEIACVDVHGGQYIEAAPSCP
jgi:hypothetical protein